MGSSSAVSTWERVKLPLQGPRFPTTKTKKSDKLKKKIKKIEEKNEKGQINVFQKNLHQGPRKL